MITGVILGTAALGVLVSLFGDRYECSPEEAQEACKELSNISNNTLQAISDEIGKEVRIVNNAASGLLDISNMNAYAPAVQDSITNLISVLNKQAEIIEEYNNGSRVEKMLGTGTMAIFNLTEGVLKFSEDIVDAGANIIAGVGTFCGFDMEEVELWAAKDHIGDAFDNAFENGALSWVEKYSIYSHESTAAEIFKGIGTAIPYIALAATGVGLVAEAGIAGAAGFGRGSTNYQQQHLEYDANGVASFDDTYSTGSMMWEGTKQGAFDAALTVGMDVGLKAVGKGISKLRAGRAVANSADDVVKGAIENVDDAVRTVANSGDDVVKGAVENVDDAVRTVANSGDDVVKGAVENVDDAVRTVANSGDDVVKGAVENADDAVRPVANSGDDVVKGAVENADDAVRPVVNSADDTVEATVKGSDSATLSQTKQDLLKQYKSGEITRDEMLDGVRRAANPEEALKADKARLLNDFRSGKITRDEMIQGIQKSAGNAPAKNVVSQLDDAVRPVANSGDDVVKGAVENTDGAGRTLVNGASETGENAFTRYAKQMSEGEKLKYDSFLRRTDDAVGALDNVADDAEKVAIETAEQTAREAATETAEQTARKAATETAEQTTRKTATQSGSKWHSPLEATTPRAKITKAYDTAVENMKNAASDVKSKIKGAFDGMKPSGSTAATGPRIGDNSIPARVTQAYDDAVDGLKNAGAKAGSAAKRVVTDTAAFVKANPKRALIGGGIIAGEKAIGNMKTSYIPTNYASAEVQELSKVGGGENRIVIDEIDDLPEPTPPEPTPPEPTPPEPTTPEPTTPKPTPPEPTTPKPTTPKPTPPEPTTPEPTTPEPTTPEPTPGDNVNTEVSNPPSNNNQGSSGTNHGGTTNNNTGNSSTGNNNWSSNTTTEPGIEENPELEPELPIEDPDLIDEPNEEESVYTIPSNLSGVKTTKKTSSGSSVLPILGGLGAAAAVGVGAKMYLDNKKNNENGDDDEEYSEGDDENFNTSENDDLLADEWNGEDTEFNYEDPSGNNIAEPDDDLGEM